MHAYIGDTSVTTDTWKRSRPVRFEFEKLMRGNINTRPIGDITSALFVSSSDQDAPACCTAWGCRRCSSPCADA